MCSQTDQEKKKEKTNHQYERGDSTTNPTDIKRIENTTTLVNCLDKMDQILEKYKLPNSFKKLIT